MKKLVSLILALVMCASLFACGSGEKNPGTPSGGDQPGNSSSPKSFDEYTLADWEAYAEANPAKYKLLYIPSWAASEYFQNSYAVWKKQCEALGWEMDIQGPKEYTSDSQLATLEAALISQEYDAIILYPINAEAFTTVKDDFWDTYHTPIIIWGMSEETNCGQYYMMNSDRYKMEGEFMAQMVFDYVDDNADYFSKYDGKGIPVVIFGQANNPIQNARVLRAEELLKADGRFNIVEHYENVSDEKTQQYAEAMLLNHPEAEIIVSYNDVLGIYIENSLKETAVSISDHLRIFSSDGTKAAIASMNSGDTYFGGSAMSNHTFMGELIISSTKVAVPAAEHGIIVSEKTAQMVDEFVKGQNTINITPANVADYYTAE